MCKQLIRFFYPLSGDESKYIKQEISAGNRPALSINSRFKRWTTNLLCSIANKPKPFNLEKVKGIIFDYGATIDTNGKHWAETLWDAYQDANVPVTKDAFRDAYVYVERFFATHSIIKPRDNFKAVLTAKTKFQIKWLIDNGFLNDDNNSSQYSVSISNKCYNFVCSVLTDAKPVLEKLKLKYPLVLVSNFYGNMEAVLNDFGLDNYFEEIIESAKVNIRKPNPAIFELGVKALGLDSRNVVVIGDSWTKDIAPAQKTGCQTIWLKGLTWETCKEGQRANLVIDDFKKLEEVFNV
ncbi:MAG: HAD family hydrolase [Dysgonamonadaceae bacterium]|nr:HAD family hydrolase [Dysgonamonadaceae bacterium]